MSVKRLIAFLFIAGTVLLSDREAFAYNVSYNSSTNMVWFDYNGNSVKDSGEEKAADNSIWSNPNLAYPSIESAGSFDYNQFYTNKNLAYPSIERGSATFDYNQFYTNKDFPFPVLIPPVAPTSLVSSDITPSGFTISWDAAPRATSYDIGFNGTGALIDIGNVTTYNFDSLSSNTAFIIYVRAKNSVGLSDFTQITASTIVGVPVAPTCFDGKKNQNETGIDSGGVCALIAAGNISISYSHPARGLQVTPAEVSQNTTSIKNAYLYRTEVLQIADPDSSSISKKIRSAQNSFLNTEKSNANSFVQQYGIDLVAPVSSTVSGDLMESYKKRLQKIGKMP